jgi:pimeloyl-ACP methyl ester carboxylesterase
MSTLQNPGTNHPEPAAYTSQFVDLGGRKLHYQDFGTANKPVMVCLHGGAANGHWFDFAAAGFAGDYHVIAPDQRGHGDSDWTDPPAYSYHDYAADLDRLAAKLDLRDFVLVGHSMGGMVAMVYAATHPGRLGKLVVVDTSIKLSDERISAMREVGNRGTSSYATREELIGRYRLRPGNSLARPEVVRHIAEHSVRQFPDGGWRYKFDRSVYALREGMDGLPFWDNIKVPSLLVKAGQSQRITPEILAAVKARAPQTEFVEVPGCDHHVMLDNPGGFVAAVRPFLA